MIRRNQRNSNEAQMFTSDAIKERNMHAKISNVIYHKILHGAASYMLYGKHVSLILELKVNNDSIKTELSGYVLSQQTPLALKNNMNTPIYVFTVKCIICIH